jgi:hypothetical protein
LHRRVAFGNPLPQSSGKNKWSHQMSFEANMNLPSSLEYNGVSIDLENASEESLGRTISYLLSYGFGKSLQDSVAGRAKELRDEGESEKKISDTIREEMTERAEAILAGTIGARGPRLVGPDAIRRDVTEEFFRTWVKDAAAKGQILVSLKTAFNVSTKDATKEQKKAVADKINALREKFAKARNDRIELEVARRLALQETDSGDDLDLDLDLDA